MPQRKAGDAGLSRSEGHVDMRKVSTVKDTEVPKRKDTVSEYDKRSVTSTMGTSLAGILATKRLARKLTSRVGGSWGNRSRTSNVEPVVSKEPTYRMEPRKMFCSGHVKTIIKSCLEERLQGFQYAPQQGSIACRLFAEEIKERVKTLGYDRYKIVCQVTMGEKAGQSMLATSRCIWDNALDSSATYTYEAPTLYCTATVFGIYNE